MQINSVPKALWGIMFDGAEGVKRPGRPGPLSRRSLKAACRRIGRGIFSLPPPLCSWRGVKNAGSPRFSGVACVAFPKAL